MEFFLKIFGIVTVFFIVKYCSFLLKRIKMYCKLIRECKKNGAKLVATRFLWLFSHSGTKSNDLYIETEKKIFSIKFFSANSKRSQLFFLDNGYYFFRKYIVFIGAGATSARFSYDSKHKKIPSYDFKKKFSDEWYIKDFVPVLLIHPCHHEFLRQVSNNKFEIINAGEKITGISILSLSDLLRTIREENYENSQFATYR